MGDEQQLESFPVAPKPAKERILRLLRRFWYIPMILLILVLSVSILVFRHNSTERAWKAASDNYGRADYEKAAANLKGLGVPSDATRLNVYSQTMLATRQLDKALTGYEKLYELKKDPAVKLIIGNIYNEQKKYDLAEKNYQESITNNPSYVQAYVNLATLYKMQGKTSEAVETAQRAVKSNPKSAQLYELLVSMLMDKKSSPEYLAAVKALTEINPNDPLLESLKK